MTKTVTLIAALAFAISLAGTADAAKPCKDAKTGKFMKCPVAAAAPKHCKDPKTHKFAKCSAPGAVPA